MFINNALAATEASAQTGALGGTLVQLALILLIFYFFLIRPQQKKMREHAAMVAALKVGDKVLLSNGIYGKITKTLEDKLMVEIAAGVEVAVDRMTVGMVVSDEKKAIKSEDKQNNSHKNKKGK